jgi:hypothetical protein
MPQCKKCGDGFPNRLQVATGVYVNAQRRKYCLTCSPFGSHNTSKLHDREQTAIPGLSPLHGKPVKCALCFRNYVYNRAQGHRSTICNSCNANQQRRSRKKAAVAYKGGKCERCGYKKCVRSLGFHHRDRKEKELSISQMMSLSWNRLKREIDKCDLLCANCHMEEEDWRMAHEERAHP